MSFTELPLSFWDNALETAAKLLNIAISKAVAQMIYHIWHSKPTSYKYLRVWDSPAYVKRLVGDKLDLRSSLCRFIGYLKDSAGYMTFCVKGTSPAPTIPIDDIPVIRRSARVPQPPKRPGLWQKDILGDLGSILRKQISLVAMAKSIRIMLAIGAWYDYEIWQMDVKMAFLNDFIEERDLYDQPEGFRLVGEE
ncbi:UNVERIFIED_CONTAM: hypothetical protein Slati_0224300 [Sesamum latifolium]|uniref:Reverse transcriptase Ty1/copia-type domain-containing protein n=1 Tax=Sesamum latifolium TaxID=2727402 RepID=A0AAW2YC18_9LAMI